MMAWGRRHFHDVNYAKQADPMTNDYEPSVEIMKRMERTSKRLLKQWGCQPWKQFVPFLAFPGWLVGIEALRRLCSGPVGLLGTFLGRRDADSTKEAAETVTGTRGTSETVMAQAAETTQQAVSPATEGIAEATSTTTTADLTNTLLPDFLSPYLQHAMPTSMEGMLWFPDLLAADPHYLLPGLLSLVMFLNVMPRNRAGWHRLLTPRASNAEGLNPHNIGEHASRIKLQKDVGLRMQRALLVLTFCVGPMTANLPAALHLYWIATSLTSNVITSVVAAKMPLPPSLGPAKGRGDEPYIRAKLPGLDWEPDPNVKKRKGSTR